MVFVTYIVLLLQAVLFAQYPHCKRSPPDANRNGGQRPQKHPFANGIFHFLKNKGATRTHISIKHAQASWAHDHLFSFKGAENMLAFAAFSSLAVCFKVLIAFLPRNTLTNLTLGT